jgi:glycosyltransferase involved in cell wall biosynthesis
LFGIKALDVPGGGAERVLTIVASGLAASGHDVIVLTFDAPGGESFYPMDSRIRRIPLGLGPTDRRTGWKHFFARVRALRRVVREEEPDVAVGFMHSMFVPLAFSTIGLGTPLVASEHIVPEYYRDRRGEYGLFMVGCLLSARVTVLSATVRQLYPRLLRGRMVPMANPVVLLDARNVDGDDALATKTALSVGRLEPQKDHATLIAAFARIADRFPDWNLRIVGEGGLRDQLEGMVSDLDLNGRVALPGTTAEIDAEYARAQLLAVPSRFESFGMVTAEAMAVGLPVVGFADCAGTNELITHDANGWLVHIPDGEDRVSAYARALSILMGDVTLRRRLGTEGRRSVRRFHPDEIVANWERLLRTTMER